MLAAARAAFLDLGYPAAIIGEIAGRAGVHLDTVYATVGRKPALIRAVVEAAISGTGQAVTAEERDYVRRIRAADSAVAKITVYAAALAEMAPRTVPVLALSGPRPPPTPSAQRCCTRSPRRAANMRSFAAGLRATGELRDEVDDAEVADVVWALSSDLYDTLLVEERGWTAERYASHLEQAWRRLFLA